MAAPQPATTAAAEGSNGEMQHATEPPYSEENPESPRRGTGGPGQVPPAGAASGDEERRRNIGRPWTTGLFDCGRNETNAMLTAYCPCVTFGQNAELLDEGKTNCSVASLMYIMLAPALCTCWILGGSYRKQLREKYGLVEAPAGDCILHLFCPCCALCQEFRELQNRGMDPSLGWMGYLAQQQETKTAPPNGQYMNK